MVNFFPASAFYRRMNKFCLLCSMPTYNPRQHLTEAGTGEPVSSAGIMLPSQCRHLSVTSAQEGHNHSTKSCSAFFSFHFTHFFVSKIWNGNGFERSSGERHTKKNWYGAVDRSGEYFKHTSSRVPEKVPWKIWGYLAAHQLDLSS